MNKFGRPYIANATYTMSSGSAEKNDFYRGLAIYVCQGWMSPRQTTTDDLGSQTIGELSTKQGFVDLLCFCSVLCLLCLCARLLICALWSPAGKG